MWQKCNTTAAWSIRNTTTRDLCGTPLQIPHVLHHLPQAVARCPGVRLVTARGGAWGARSPILSSSPATTFSAVLRLSSRLIWRDSSRGRQRLRILTTSNNATSRATVGRSGKNIDQITRHRRNPAEKVPATQSAVFARSPSRCRPACIHRHCLGPPRPPSTISPWVPNPGHGPRPPTDVPTLAADAPRGPRTRPVCS